MGRSAGLEADNPPVVPQLVGGVEAVLPKGITLAGVDQLVMSVRVALAKKYAPATVTLSWGYLAAVMRSRVHERSHPSRPHHRRSDATMPQRRRRTRRSRRRADARRRSPRVWSAAPARYRALLLRSARPGLRIGEVLGLTGDRVDVEQRLVVIDRQLRTHRRRDAPPHRRARSRARSRCPGDRAELRRHLREHQGGGLLFRAAGAAEVCARHEFYAQAWRPALVGGGLASDRYVFHSLRHFARCP